jgi:catalase-peroxidase
MTVLIGGLRKAGRQRRRCQARRVHTAPGRAQNDFFANLLDMKTEWKPAPGDAGVFEGRDRKSGEPVDRYRSISCSV